MPIKSPEICDDCCYGLINCGVCRSCDMFKPQKGGEIKRCLCLTIRPEAPCPYFKPLHPKEHTEEPDYDEMLRTLF